MTGPTDLLEHAKELFPEPESGVAEVRAVVARRGRNRRLATGLVVAAIWLVIVATAFVLGSHERDHVPVDRTPPPAAAPGTLAYAFDGDIYVAYPDGSNVVKIADGFSEQDCAATFGGGGEYWTETDDMWSPDGRYLAYRYSDCGSSREDGPKGVVISDAQGNVLAKFPTGMGWQIRWAPNADLVAVWDDCRSTVGIYEPDGARQTQLTLPPGGACGGDTDPYWTPDGTSVLVFGGPSGWTELPLDGGAPRAYPSYWNQDNPPVSSPDGSRIAYLDVRSLMVANADGSHPQEVLGDCVGDPVWSPTGDRIAVPTAARGDGSPVELRVLDVATGSTTVVTEAEPGWSLEVVGFSPKGNRIFYTTQSKGSWLGWSVGVDGSDARLMVDGTLDASVAKNLPDNFYRAPWSPQTGIG